jgi:hypothetical protein
VGHGKRFFDCSSLFLLIAGARKSFWVGLEDRELFL